MAERRPLSAEEIRRIEAFAASRAAGTLYDVLGVPAGASEKDVEAAYHEIARQWHPDRFYSRETGTYGSVIEENFVAATRAFRTLRDTNKRLAYHREIGLDARVVVAPPTIARPAEPKPDVRTVKASETSPGGTPVYETGFDRAARLQRARPPAPPPAPPPKPKAPPAVEKLKQQIAEQFGKARSYYDAGRADLEAGRYAKAESALYLATKFDPKNPEFQALYEKAAAAAREGRAKGYIVQAEQDESYARYKEAIGWYQKAVECDPPDGVAWFRLAQLLHKHENDTRSAVANLRKAVTKEPKNVAYRVALAEAYEALGLGANAVREAQAALDADPKSEPAKALMKRVKR